MADFYVTTGGNDTTGDGSSGNPWASLHKACSVVSGVGDIINVAAGSYTDNVQAVLAVGVHIQGADKTTTTISTTANPYISAQTAVPVVDGSNEISGIKFIASNNSSTLINSSGRSNQLIHDNAFQDSPEAILIQGKAPASIATCTDHETTTAIHCENYKPWSIYPATTDWSEGDRVYNNTLVNAKIQLHTIKGALIHDNTIDNTSAARSAIGHTSYYWNNVEVYNNTIQMNSSNLTTIAIEAWHLDSNCKIHDNASDAWFSFNFNPNGIPNPYSLQIYNNDFSSDVVSSVVKTCIEIAGWISNVRIYGNYIANTGANNTWDTGINIDGAGTISNIQIDHNVFYKVVSSDVDLNSIQTWPDPMNLDNVYICNNVFEHAVGNGSSAILFENDATHGDIDGVSIRNNLFMNMARAVGAFPNPITVSGNFFDHNMIDLTLTEYIGSNIVSTFTVANNFTAAPQILATGDRWKNYYKPTPAGNLVDVGVNVGFPFTGAAPDIGVFEEPPVSSILAPTLFVVV